MVISNWKDFWEYIYSDMVVSDEPDFEVSLKRAIHVFFKKEEGKTESKDMSVDYPPPGRAKG